MHHTSSDIIKYCAALALATLLGACGGGGGGGGGGGDGGASDPGAQAPTPCRIKIEADSDIARGKTASATVLSCAGESLSDIRWTQTAGPAVDLPASRSPTVAIETAVTGSIGLRADVVLGDGSKVSASTTIRVGTEPNGPYVTARSDHSVRPGQTTTIVAWPSSTGDMRSLRWSQVSGPSVTLTPNDDYNMLTITAPQSGTDVALKFRVSMTTFDGRTDFDDVTISVDPQAAAPAGALFDSTQRVHPYRQAAAYAPVLARCAYDNSLYYRESGDNLCTSSTLPLLQTEAGIGAIPSVEQIMGRVLVSHDFLGANFEQFLRTQDVNGDFRRLLAAATAVVIGSHVRPSYYTPGTGAIYLDAGYLWLTPAQLDVVNSVDDYRVAFAAALNFRTLGRQVRDNAYARRTISYWDRESRQQSDLLNDLGPLLYHELAHAADFFPTTDRTLIGTRSVWDNLIPRLVARTLASDVLAQQYPLRSVPMKALGQVLFQGATATAEQKAYTAAQVGAFFAADVASDEYAYAINEGDNSREDLAMLFEEFMMGYRHNIRYDVAYTNLYPDTVHADDMVVEWGERGRIAEAGIKPRVKLVVQRVAPWIDPAMVDELPAPLLLRTGVTWAGNLVQPGPTTNSASAIERQSARRIETPAQRAERSRADLQKRAWR